MTDCSTSESVESIQIAGYEAVDNLFVTCNVLKKGKPKDVVFKVTTGISSSRPTPKLSSLIAEKLIKHADFEVLDWHEKGWLGQKSRKTPVDK